MVFERVKLESSVERARPWYVSLVFTIWQVSLERGWGVETSRIGVNDAEDPMMQQMQIIRNYIQQARYLLSNFLAWRSKILRFSLF